MIVLAESHLALHSYPEFGIANVTLCSCEEREVEEVLQPIVQALECSDYEIKIVEMPMPDAETKQL